MHSVTTKTPYPNKPAEMTGANATEKRGRMGMGGMRNPGLPNDGTHSPMDLHSMGMNVGFNRGMTYKGK